LLLLGASMNRAHTRLVAALLGTEHDEPLRALFIDALREIDPEIHVDVVVPAPGGRDPNVILAMVERGDLACLGRAAACAPETAVIAVLPFRDDELEARAAALGATACFALSSPLADLRRLIRSALGPGPLEKCASATEERRGIIRP
jgi:hypothetical protein